MADRSAIHDLNLYKKLPPYSRNSIVCVTQSPVVRREKVHIPYTPLFVGLNWSGVNSNCT